MMHYKKGKNIEEELSQDRIPIEGLPEQFMWMHVKGGSQVFNLIDCAKKALDAGEYRSLVWSGSGGGVGKTISCAEIMKRSYELHQVTRICYSKSEEFWNPQQEGLEQIVATRKIPSIHILMSLDEIDPKTPGYQHSKTKTCFWLESDPGAKNGENRRGGNYFTGPQLKRRPNKHYEKNGTSGGASDESANTSSGSNKGKNRNRNKNNRTTGEGEPSGKQKKQSQQRNKNAKSSENGKQLESSSNEAGPSAEP